MNEVEKMYENAGVKADRIVCYRGFDNCIDNDFNCHCHNEKPCKDATKIYPPFTAEKQIELIKWLINEVDYITMWHFNNSKKPYDFDLGRYNSGGETFEDALAQMINNLWQDLTEEECKQIKEILE